MAQLVKFLLCKHEDLSLDPHYPYFFKKMDIMACICNSSATRQRQADPQGLLRSQSSKIYDLQVQFETMSQNIMWERD